MKSHVVKRGECLSSIAAKYGFTRWQTVYQHAANAELRAKRPNPHVIHPGDLVAIPDAAARSETGATNKRHVFVKKEPRRELRIQLIDDEGNQLAKLPFMADDGTRIYAGDTDKEGILTLDLPVTVTVDVLGWTRTFELGELNPVVKKTDDDGVSGAQGRLAGLGFDAGPIDGVLGPRTKAALVAFQRSTPNLEPSGELDTATRAALEERFKS